MSEYEPITAELRRVMNHTTMAGVPLVEIGEYEFGHRCDAIDAVHAGLERENAELRERVAVLDNGRGNMHDGWVRLPKDADGEAWRTGDELLDDGMVCEVVGIGPNRLYYYVDATDTVEWTQADSRRHYHAPTVEDVLREFGKAWVEWEDGSPHDPIAKFAARLRLVGDDE